MYQTGPTVEKICVVVIKYFPEAISPMPHTLMLFKKYSIKHTICMSRNKREIN